MASSVRHSLHDTSQLLLNSAGSSGTGTVGGESDFADLVADEDTKKSLECPICLSIALPPIYNCETGHIICHGCKKQLDGHTCVLCKSDYTDSRNFPLESLVQAAKFFCAHRHKGCEVTGTLADLKNHYLVCEFRPIRCHLKGMDSCSSRTVVYLSDYVSHLEEVHKHSMISCDEDNLHVFRASYSVSLEEWKSDFDEDFIWRGNLFRFEDDVFMDLVCNRGPIFHFGLFLVNGTPSDAAKYHVQITLEKATYLGAIKNEVITPLTTIQEFLSKREHPYFVPRAVAVHKAFLNSVGEVKSLIGEPNKFAFEYFTWSVKYKIIKL